MASRSSRLQLVLVSSVAAFAICSALAFAGARRPARAQDARRTATQAALVQIKLFKADGEPVRAREKVAPAMPRPLTAAQRSSLLKAAGLDARAIARSSPYAVLSAGRPIVQNRGALVFMHPVFTDPGTGEAYFVPLSRDESYVRDRKGFALWLKSEGPGKRYLVDCSVHNLVRPVTLHVRGPGGIDQTARFDGAGHLTWVVETTDANWYGFNVGLADEPWWVYRCEATRL